MVSNTTVTCFIALKNGRALNHFYWLYYCFAVQYYDKVFHFSYRSKSIATRFVTILLFSRSILLFSSSILHNNTQCNIQIWYSWTNGMHTKIHCSAFWRVWHFRTAQKLSDTFLRILKTYVIHTMSGNKVHIHPLYEFDSVVGTFRGCACLLLFVLHFFGLVLEGLTLFGPCECIVLFCPSRCLLESCGTCGLRFHFTASSYLDSTLVLSFSVFVCFLIRLALFLLMGCNCLLF